MKTLHWKPTYETPEVLFSQPNTLCINGKSIVEDAISFYQPIIKKIQYSSINSLHLEFDLKKVNALSKKMLIKLIETAKLNPFINDLQVVWMVEPSDEFGYDLGKELELTCDMPFEYLEFV